MTHRWPLRQFGDVCQLKKGRKPVLSAVCKDGYKPYLVARVLRGDEAPQFASVADKNSVTVRKDEIIIICDGSNSGETFSGFDGILSSTMAKVTHGIDLDTRFLQLYLESLFEHFSSTKTGSAIPHLDLAAFKAQPFPLPSLPEQEHVVTSLTQVLNSLATVKIHTEGTLRSVNELFETELNAVFEQPRDGWHETTLGAEVDLLTGFPFQSRGYTESNDSIRLLRGDNIVQGTIRWNAAKKWPVSESANYESYQLQDGDAVLAMDRTWVKAGLKYAVIHQNDLPCLLVQRTARLRSGPRIGSSFLGYLLGSRKFSHYVLAAQKGSGVPHISAQQIKDFQFVVPPLSEQRNLVATLTELEGAITRLRTSCGRKLSTLDELKRSCFYAAFNGNL